MQPIPLVPSRALLPLFDYVRRTGVPQSATFERIRTHSGSTGLVPLALAGLVWDEAARAFGRDDLGLRVGETTRLEDAGELGPVVRRACTVGAALEAAVQFGSRFNSGQRFCLERRGEEILLHRVYAPALRRGRLQVNDYVLTLTLNLIRLAAGAGWRPSEIHFEGAPPSHAAELAGLAQRSVRFGQHHTTLVFPRRVLALPIPEPQPAAASGARSAPIEWPHADFAGSARQAVRSLMQLGCLDLALAAAAAGTSVRSFQRRLGQAGLRFADLVDETRFEAACRLLQDPAARIVDVSAELGYTDSANFTRAFRRWAGMPPQQYRRLAAS